MRFDIFKKILLVLLMFFVVYGAEAKIVEFDSFKLDNGLEVVVVSNHRAPVGLVKLYYKVGSVNDPFAKGGAAHLLEHLMFRGTKNVKDKEFNRITEENGADNNAFTTHLYTGYYEFSDISKLELMLALEADRMENLKIDDEAFYKERDVVLEERKQRFETNAVTKFYESLDKLLFVKHPFARPVSGEVEEIKNLEKKDVMEFYEKYYKPSNAILVLGGDIKKDEAKFLADKYFGKIKNREEKIEEVNVLEEGGSEIVYEMKMDGIESKRFVAFWYLPKGALKKNESVALDLVCEFLSGDDTSYLYDKLVYKDKKFLSVGLEASYDEKFGGRLILSGVPVDDNMSIKEFRKNMEEAIYEGILSLDNGKDDFEKLKNEILSNSVYLLENVTGMADFVGDLKVKGYSDDEIKSFDEMIKNISKDDVKKVYKKVLEVAKRKIYGEIDKKEN